MVAPPPPSFFISFWIRLCGAILYVFFCFPPFPTHCLCVRECFIRYKFKWSKCQRRKLIFLLFLFSDFFLSPFLLGIEHSTGPSISNEYFIHFFFFFFFFWCALFAGCQNTATHIHTHSWLYRIFYFLKT